MKALTERQIRRRETILATARKLIAERGFDGVNMRDLARESGVAPKTLYHQFGNKERLLMTAVEERFRFLYQSIEDAQIDKGIDRLYHIIDSVAAATQKNLEYAKALAAFFNRDTETPIARIRRETYRRAVEQIAEDGDFVDWVDTALINKVIYQQVIAVAFSTRWYEKESARNPTFSLVKLDVSLVLRSVTKGYTQRRTTETIKEIQAKLKTARPA